MVSYLNLSSLSFSQKELVVNKAFYKSLIIALAIGLIVTPALDGMHSKKSRRFRNQSYNKKNKHLKKQAEKIFKKDTQDAKNWGRFKKLATPFLLSSLITAAVAAKTPKEQCIKGEHNCYLINFKYNSLTDEWKTEGYTSMDLPCPEDCWDCTRVQSTPSLTAPPTLYRCCHPLSNTPNNCTFFLENQKLTTTPFSIENTVTVVVICLTAVGLPFAIYNAAKYVLNKILGNKGNKTNQKNTFENSNKDEEVILNLTDTSQATDSESETDSEEE